MLVSIVQVYTLIGHPCPAGTSARIRAPIAVLGVACAALGLVVLTGWYLHLPALVQVRADLPPMQFNTALCFVMAGMALMVWAWDRLTQAMPILGGLVAAFGLTTAAEYLFHANLRIDQAFFHSYITTQTSNVGRMSPVSALCFALAGLGLVLLGLRSAPRWSAAVVGSAASIIISISLVAILGYVFGLPGTYGWGQLTRVAMHTAAGLGLIGTALFIIAWQMALHPRERTPRWLPVPLALGIFTGSLVLYFALDARQNEQITQTVRTGAESVRNQIAVRMDARIRSLTRMARRWEFSGPPTQASWEDDAANYVHDFPDMQALEWIDAGHKVRWIVPLAGNEAKLNRDLTLEERRKAAVDEAEREHQPVITRILTLLRGGLGFVVYTPIVFQGHSDGFVAAVFVAQPCLDRYLPPAVAAGEAIELSEGGAVFYKRETDAGSTPPDWMISDRVELHGATWDLKMWPTPELAARLDSSLPGVVLCAGVLCSLLLGAVCYFSQRYSRTAAETTLANAALRSALDKVRTLEGLLPICSCCKRVRDDTGYWSQIDTYIHQHTNASLSHGYCPECAAKTFKDFGFEVPQEVQAQLDAGNFEKNKIETAA